MPDVITEPDLVTPEWLSAVLRRDRPDWDGHVTAVRVETVKRLPYSRVASLRVSYSAASHDQLPDHIFLKLSALGVNGEKPADNGSEVNFYRTVASEMQGPPLVRCYDAEYSPYLDRSHVLLEDLSASHFQTEQREHPSRINSELAVKCLAEFHAYWWEHPKLGNKVGKVFDGQWLEAFLRDLETSVTEFLDVLGNQLTIERRRAFEQMLLSSRTIWGRLTEPRGLTATHGDTHWWNFLFPNDPHKEHTRIIDWQLWHIDLGPRDLAFLIALGGFAERKPELEMHLLRTYHETLGKCGVQNYSWAQFWEDYRWSAIRNLNIPVIFHSQGKHRNTWENALERAFQSYDEMNCAELI